MDINEAVELELIEEEKRKVEEEYAAKPISEAPVKGAKYAWMGAVFLVDLATAYALYEILSPYWWYAAMWLLSGAGGLLFADWLRERVGNNFEQCQISDTGKNISAISVIVMALFAGVVLVLGITRTQWVEVVAFVSALGLFCFHAIQAYRYYHNDDGYIAKNEEARANADAVKELRKLHRAGLKVKAKQRVITTGAGYQKQYGGAFRAAAGRSFDVDVNDSAGDVLPAEKTKRATTGGENYPTPGRKD